MRDYDIESDCFNPCFIGTYSFTFYSYNTVWKIRIWVLILVLLELILLQIPNKLLRDSAILF